MTHVSNHRGFFFPSQGRKFVSGVSGGARAAAPSRPLPARAGSSAPTRSATSPDTTTSATSARPASASSTHAPGFSTARLRPAPPSCRQAAAPFWTLSLTGPHLRTRSLLSPASQLRSFHLLPSRPKWLRSHLTRRSSSRTRPPRQKRRGNQWT